MHVTAMSTVELFLFVTFLHATIAANCYGGNAGSSRLVYNASQTIDDTDGKPVRCDYNLCKTVDIVITRVEITGDFECVAGGPGDYNVAIIVQGWKSFHANIWATGKDAGRIVNPYNEYTFPCSLNMSDKC